MCAFNLAQIEVTFKIVLKILILYELKDDAFEYLSFYFLSVKALDIWNFLFCNSERQKPDSKVLKDLKKKKT